MIVKSLIKHGNSKAIVIDKALLAAAGLDEDTLFQISVDPNGGITIQSIQPVNEDLFKKSMDRVLKKNKNLLKRLSDR